MGRWAKLKHFFGFFNLTSFETDLLSCLRENLPSEWKEALDSQISLFNKVDRVIEPAKEIPFGHTSFYWVRFGKARFDFPEKFPTEKEEDLLATVDVVDRETNETINVRFVLVHGFLFSIEYRSKNKIFCPSGEYKIENFRLILQSSKTG